MTHQGSAAARIDAREVTRLFRTLSDETRFRLLRLLWREELTVNELAAISQLAQPRISNHLKILREENLIVERREGSWRHYRVDQDRLDELALALWPSLTAAWGDEAAFAGDDKRLSEVLAAREPLSRDRFFEELAGHWDDIRHSLFGDALGREILRTFLPEEVVVADIGTGTGYVLELFAGHARRLIAVDNSEAMLDAARRKAEANGWQHVEFRLADAASSPLKPGEADVVTVVQVLHHIDDPEGMITGLAKGLRKGGRMIVSDFLEHDQSWLRTRLNHRWPGFSRERWGRICAAAGLRPAVFEVIPGRVWTSPEGHRLLVPDGFTAVAVSG